MANYIVLAAIDLHHKESDKHIVEEALALARSHSAELHLAFVIPDENYGYVQAYIPAEMRADLAKKAHADAKAKLGEFGTSMDAGGVSVETHILRGSIYDEIVKLSDRINATTVVIGAHKPGIMDIFLGPNSARVARYAKCNVMIIRPERAE